MTRRTPTPPAVGDLFPSDDAPVPRILLVDDDQRNLLALGHVLRDLAEVVTASSGAEALRHLLRDDFAVVLLDVFMPGMDGYEVADLIRKREQTARTPIIFLSAVNKETEHLMRGYSMGAVDYVFKPVDSLVLKSKVSVFVDLYRMRTQIETKSRAEQRLREANYRAELERLQMQAELQETRGRQAAMLEALPLALFEADIDSAGNLVRRFVGGDLSRIAGSDGLAIEAGSLRWEDRIEAEDAAQIRRKLTQRDGRTAALEYRWNGSDGLRHFIEQVVPAGDGPDSGWVGTLIDVTERKQLESQLLQAGKLDAIGQLTGGVAHDFNNLLATVLGGIELLERRVALGQREEMIVSRMRYAAEKGSELVKRMMAFARKQDLRPVAIEPKRLCRAVGGLVEQTLGGTISIVWNCGGGDHRFLADEAQLELALVNLIINARDAMPDGGQIMVDIASATPEAVAAAGLGLNAGPEGYLCIRVTDEGTGMPPELVARVTEPFFTTKQVGKGTGLGLSMVSGFVEQSNGWLGFETAPGRGTTVTLFLPATLASADRRLPATQVRTDRDFSVRSVLLVDDDENVRTVVAEQLRDLGIAVEVASSAAMAFELLQDSERKYDLLISDFAMPGTNGIQTVLRAKELRPDIRTVIMTGFLDCSTPDSALQGTAVLRKPIQTMDLAAILA